MLESSIVLCRTVAENIKHMFEFPYGSNWDTVEYACCVNVRLIQVTDESPFAVTTLRDSCARMLPRS